jgi:nitronate monooxygenase
MKRRTKKPIGINIIVNKSNTRQADDLKIALENGVELFITSLGNPASVIRDAHKNGAKVFCDVTNLEHAKKAIQAVPLHEVLASGEDREGDGPDVLHQIIE